MKGDMGEPGLPGQQGADGRDGIDGEKGEKGEPGPPIERVSSVSTWSSYMPTSPLSESCIFLIDVHTTCMQTPQDSEFCPKERQGVIRFDTNTNRLVFCNGTHWLVS